MKTDDELKLLDELEAIESNTLHLVVGGALGARQMHLTPHHGRKSVCHCVSFHCTIFHFWRLIIPCLDLPIRL